jgi:hypothetical protein
MPSRQRERCERRLASLVDALDADGDNPLLATLRELCVGAREQRRIADVLRAGLIGTVAAPNSAAAVKRPLVLIVDDSPDSRGHGGHAARDIRIRHDHRGNGLEG